MLAICLSMLEDPDDSIKFEKLHARCHAKMFRFAYGITGNEYDTKECVQNSFVNLARTFHKLSDWDTWRIEHYLRQIVKNEAFKIIEQRNNGLVHFDIELHDYFETSETPESLLIDKEVYTKVVDCIKRLPSTYRNVLNMHFVCEMKPKAIADALGKPLNTVKSTIRRGRKMLEAVLKEGK